MTAHRGRVVSENFGPGTVVAWDSLPQGYVEVQFDNGELWQVDVHLLDPLPDPPPQPAVAADPTFLQRLNDDDLEALGREWASECGSCDAGLPTYCTCPPDDPRAVIARLITEVQRLRIIEAAQLPAPKETGRWQR